MIFNKKLIKTEEIVDVVKCNPLYSWEIRILGSVKFIGVIEDLYGTKRWYKNGKKHRKEGPAVENSDGDKYWYKEGKYHRLDGPALEWSNGEKFWFKEGERHRENGPAIEYSDGTKFWYIEGIRYSPLEFERKKVSFEF